MKRGIFEGLALTIGILFMVWFVASWADVVADNSQPNPTHSDWNLFTILFQEEKEKEEIPATCGNSITKDIRITCGWITDINYDENILTMEDEDGETWAVEVGDAQEFAEQGYYCIFFDTMGTADLYSGSYSSGVMEKAGNTMKLKSSFTTL